MIKRNLLLCLLGAMSICLAECGLKEKTATYVMMKLNNINFNYIDKSLLFYILQILYKFSIILSINSTN